MKALASPLGSKWGWQGAEGPSTVCPAAIGVLLVLHQTQDPWPQRLPVLSEGGRAGKVGRVWGNPEKDKG